MIDYLLVMAFASFSTIDLFIHCVSQHMKKKMNMKQKHIPSFSRLLVVRLIANLNDISIVNIPIHNNLFFATNIRQIWAFYIYISIESIANKDADCFLVSWIISLEIKRYYQLFFYQS